MYNFILKLERLDPVIQGSPLLPVKILCVCRILHL